MLRTIDQIVRSYGPFEIIIEIAVIWACVYLVLRFLKGTRGAGIVKGFAILGVIITLLFKVLGTGTDDSIEDPEPIPGVFSSDDEVFMDDGSDKKMGKGKIIGIAATVLVLALGAGLFFGRTFIIDMVPQAAGIYEMLDFGGSEVGEGLDIRNVKSLREVESGVDILIVRGEVSNVSEEDRMVPMIRVVLYDGEGEEVQSTIAAPLKNRLPPGTSIGFSAKLPEPSALARRLEVTFTETKNK